MKYRLKGNRRTILGILGVPFAIFGIAILTHLDSGGEELLPEVVKITGELFGWLWIVAGVFAIVAMIVSRRRGAIEDIGYGVLILPPITWAMGYFTSLLYGGGFSAFVGFLVATTLVVLVLYLARFMRNG